MVGVDPERPSRMVLAWAADEANRRHLPVHVVQAWKPVTREDIWPRLWPELHDRAHLLRTAGARALDEAARFIGERHPDLQVSARLIDGDPVEVLNRQAERAVVLALGSRPLSGVRELFHSGAVTLPLIANASCPVVVVRDPEHVTQQPAYIVVGVDGSRTSRDAVDHAFEAAALRGAELRALYAWNPSHLSVAEEHRVEQESRRVLAETAAGRRELCPGVELRHEVVRGHPVAVLAEASRHALALVVGTRGAGGFGGQLLGSVGQGVLHHARCPVVTVPGPFGPDGLTRGASG
ncbi:universal stress protein [Kitasatospora purpeofusca]|uniref:universal stress protein n=1 Tax=Kitasatospora purpeofusca TaxID=67352 RepID=UPI00224DF17F|nr:universal stress protein [Kitasatospora purpeofusca]MCX4683343.1 universal stress protein [Kitasatospora purpeofusca]